MSILEQSQGLPDPLIVEKLRGSESSPFVVTDSSSPRQEGDHLQIEHADSTQSWGPTELRGLTKPEWGAQGLARDPTDGNPTDGNLMTFPPSDEIRPFFGEGIFRAVNFNLAHCWN